MDIHLLRVRSKRQIYVIRLESVMKRTDIRARVKLLIEMTYIGRKIAERCDVTNEE